MVEKCLLGYGVLMFVGVRVLGGVGIMIFG